MPLSQRANLIPQSPIRKLAGFGLEAKKRGVKVYHLNIGQPDLPPPAAVFDFLNNYHGPVIEYSHSQGEHDYLESLVKYYHRLGHQDLDKDNFIATLGGSEAILWAIMTVADPGDEIITFEPFYTNYNSLAIMAGVKLKAVATKIEEGFHLPDKKAILSQINEKTKAIMFCNPNNPTGTVYRRAELDLLYDIAQEKNLYLLSDEVYREFAYGEHRMISILTVEKERQADLAESRVLVLDSFSKRYSLCGARVGLVCSRNKKIIAVMLRYGQARLSAGSINMLMTANIIGQDEDYLEQTLAEYAKRRQVLIDGLNRIEGLVFCEPEGAFYIIVKLPVADADEFCQWLLTDFKDRNETVMLAPAAGFYLSQGSGKDEVRLAYVLKEDDLRRAMQILAKALDKWEERRA